MDAISPLPRAGGRARGAKFSQRDRAWPQAPDAGGHRRTISTDRHTSPFRCRWSARGNRRRAFMDAGDGGAAFTHVRGGVHHSASSFLRCSDRAAYFECAGRSNELGFARRFLFRSKSFRPEQSRRCCVLSSVPGHKRTFFHRLSTLLRGCGPLYCLPIRFSGFCSVGWQAIRSCRAACCVVRVAGSTLDTNGSAKEHLCRWQPGLGRSH